MKILKRIITIILCVLTIIVPPICINLFWENQTYFYGYHIIKHMSIPTIISVVILIVPIILIGISLKKKDKFTKIMGIITLIVGAILAAIYVTILVITYKSFSFTTEYVDKYADMVNIENDGVTKDIYYTYTYKPVKLLDKYGKDGVKVHENITALYNNNLTNLVSDSRWNHNDNTYRKSLGYDDKYEKKQDVYTLLYDVDENKIISKPEDVDDGEYIYLIYRPNVKSLTAVHIDIDKAKAKDGR